LLSVCRRAVKRQLESKIVIRDGGDKNFLCAAASLTDKGARAAKKKAQGASSVAISDFNLRGNL
jgi:hypothetical protein